MLIQFPFKMSKISFSPSDIHFLVSYPAVNWTMQTHKRDWTMQTHKRELTLTIYLDKFN